MSTTTMPALSHLPAIAPGGPAPAAGLPAQETKSGGPAYAPLMLAGGGYGADAFQSLGLRRPNASGDVAALLARVAMEAEEREGENRSNRLVNSFAVLAASIASTELRDLRARVDALRDFSGAAETNLGGTTEQITPLRGELDAENVRIAELRGRMAALLAVLADPALPPEQRALVLQIYLAVVQEHDAMMSARDGTAIELAEATIGGLDRDIAALETYLETLPSGSPERAEIAGLLSQKRAQADTARGQLADFRAASPRTHEMRDRFAAETGARADAVVADLGQRSADASQKHERETRNLGIQAADALAIAARTAAAFRQSQSGTLSQDGARDLNSEKLFELIAGGIGDADARLRQALARTDEQETGRVEDERRRRVAGLSERLLGSLSTLLSALAEIDADIVPPPAPVAGRRMRFGV